MNKPKGDQPAELAGATGYAAVCETCGHRIQMGELMFGTGTGFNCAPCGYCIEANYWRKKYYEVMRHNEKLSDRR